MMIDNENYIEDQNLTKTILRMPKVETSFFYFTMEANENMAFYSTLPFEKGQNYRDIVVYTTPELYQNLKKIVSHLLKRGAHFEILEEVLIAD